MADLLLGRLTPGSTNSWSCSKVDRCLFPGVLMLLIRPWSATSSVWTHLVQSYERRITPRGSIRVLQDNKVNQRKWKAKGIPTFAATFEMGRRAGFLLEIRQTFLWLFTGWLKVPLGFSEPQFPHLFYEYHIISLFEACSHAVAQANPEFEDIFMVPFPECWDYRPEPPWLACELIWLSCLPPCGSRATIHVL